VREQMRRLRHDEEVGVFLDDDGDFRRHVLTMLCRRNLVFSCRHPELVEGSVQPLPN
jgi:hypothetical protein